MKLKLVSIAVGALLVSAALADEPAVNAPDRAVASSSAPSDNTTPPAPPPLPAEALATVPPLTCDKPKISDRASMPDEDVRYFLDKVRAYTDCVTSFIEQRQADMRHYNDLARAHAESGNEAARGINEYHVKVREFMERHSPKKK